MKKRFLSILLCLAMLLTLTACGGADAPAEAPAETASPADAYLKMAEDLLAQEKYDSAMDVLNQAKAQMEDPRLDDMIARIEENRRVFLDLEYSVNSDNLKTQNVRVSKVTAELQDETVRYDIEYTAPEGMYLKVAGTELDLCWDYQTPGGEDVFSFELDRETACAYFRTFTVQIQYSRRDSLDLTIRTQWPDAGVESLVQIPVTNDSNGDCRVNLATVRAVSDDLLHFHIDYTTPLDQQYFAALSFTESGEDTFYSVGVSPGNDMVSLMLDRETAESMDALYIRLFSENNWEGGLVAQLRSADYTLPEVPASAEAEELLIDNAGNAELPVDAAVGSSLKLDSVLIQQTPAGNLYIMKGDFSDCTTGTAYCNIRTLYYTVTMLMENPEEMRFFIPADLLNKTVGLGVEFWGQNGYVGYVSMPYDYTPASVSVLHPEKGAEAAEPEVVPGRPVRHPFWNWGMEDALNSSEVEIFDWTETILENGNSRYVLEYRATAGMNVSAFDPPNGDLLQIGREQTTSGRREYFVFEVEKDILDQIDYITVSFWSEADGGNFWVGIDRNEYNTMVTDGKPVGQEQTIKVQADSLVKVHSLKAQQLDNGHVRYTMEYTTSPGRSVSFFNPPNSDRFLYLSENIATGGRDTYVVDIPQEDNDAVTEITMKFFDLSINDHVFAHFAAARF